MSLIPNTNTSRVFVGWISLEVLIALFSIAAYGETLEALHVTTRFSGRLSLMAFSAILLLRGSKQASGWVSEKPFLLFAILHGIHLVELLTYVSLAGTVLIPNRVAGGFVAYALIFAMPVMSAKWSDEKFRKAEIFFFGYVWLIFFLSYLPRVMRTLPGVGGTYAEHVFFFGWVIALGIIRLAMIFRHKFAS